MLIKNASILITILFRLTLSKFYASHVESTKTIQELKGLASRAEVAREKSRRSDKTEEDKPREKEENIKRKKKKNKEKSVIYLKIHQICQT